ncbi:putative short chain dehydrogenase/reductase [Delphinella strobiligena]|nr:putative short chain dehydrogenase/reductase [Delphinella strobiligena]
MPFLPTLLQFLGGATAISMTYKIGSFLWLYIRPSSLPRYHHGKPNSTWALITGSNDGIGYGYAEALSNHGFNILLHGRNPNKLATVKATLSSKHPHLQFETVVADAFDYNADVDNIVAAARALPGKLTILINNVGGSPLTPMFGALDEIDRGYMDGIINLNARFPAQLTRALMPLLIANSPSLVINMTSVLALKGLPYLGVYGPSKAFNYCFSQSLGAEMLADGHDVEVLGIIVGNVTSGRNKDHIVGVTCDSAHMARVALDRVGCGRANVWGWYRHALQWTLMGLLPESVVDRETIRVMKDRKQNQVKTQ